jgi:hypothetical protein
METQSALTGKCSKTSGRNILNAISIRSQALVGSLRVRIFPNNTIPKIVSISKQRLMIPQPMIADQLFTWFYPTYTIGVRSWHQAPLGCRSIGRMRKMSARPVTAFLVGNGQHGTFISSAHRVWFGPDHKPTMIAWGIRAISQ